MSKSVMVSSTTKDLKDYRETAAEVIVDMEFTPVVQDLEVSDGVSGATQWSLDLVNSADYFVGVVAWRYGDVAPGGGTKSYVELEYGRARERGLPCHMFLLDEEVQWKPALIDNDRGPVADFRKRISQEGQGGLVANFFCDPHDFRRKLTRVLRKSITQEASSVASSSYGVRQRLSGSKWVLKAAQDDIRRVERLKSMHDSIHRILKFVVRPLRMAAQTLNTGCGWEVVKVGLQSAETNLDEQFQRLYARFYESGGYDSATVSAALTYLQSKARPSLTALVSAPPSADALREFAGELQGYQVSGAFTELAFRLYKDAAPRLMMTMENALGAIADAVQGADSEPRISAQDLDTIQRFVHSTQRSRRDLERDIESHNSWQMIHDRLVSIAITDEPKIDALVIRSLWPALNSQLQPLIQARSESMSAQKLGQFSYELFAAVGPDPASAVKAGAGELAELFARVRAAFDDEFFEVDSELNQRCSDFLDGAREFLGALGLYDTSPGPVPAH